jgi:hypothetical protein
VRWRATLRSSEYARHMSKVTLSFEVEEAVGTVLAEAAKARGEDVFSVRRMAIIRIVGTMGTMKGVLYANAASECA